MIVTKGYGSNTIICRGYGGVFGFIKGLVVKTFKTVSRTYHFITKIINR